MSHSHSDTFSQKEENVHWSFGLLFKKGGQCPLVTLTIIEKWEEIVLFQTWEENSLEIAMGELNPRKMNSLGF